MSKLHTLPPPPPPSLHFQTPSFKRHSFFCFSLLCFSWFFTSGVQLLLENSLLPILSNIIKLKSIFKLFIHMVQISVLTDLCSFHKYF